MKRRTIVAGLLMIGLVVMMLGVGSWAVFNDTETAPGTVGAGRLDLEIDQSEAGVVEVEILDLKPSEWHYAGPFILHNAGNNPGVLDLHFTKVEDEGGILTEPEHEADPTDTINDISNWIDVDYLILEPDVFVCPESGGTVLGKLADIESKVIDLGKQIEPNQDVYICLSFHLQREAGNEYQGDVTTFDVEFTLHQLLQPAGATTVRLENKDTNWDPILNDDLYGSVTYWVDGNNDLRMLVRLNGLAPNTYHQLALNGPDGTGACEPVDDQLASGSEQYTNYDSGFWNGMGPNINQGTCASPNNEGIYNFAYVQTDAQGDWEGTIVVTNSGEVDPADAGKVSAANPALPKGVYSGVKFIVKEVTGALPGTAWTPELMEMVETLNFNLP